MVQSQAGNSNLVYGDLLCLIFNLEIYVCDDVFLLGKSTLRDLTIFNFLVKNSYL
jgi:hypothetical protein